MITVIEFPKCAFPHAHIIIKVVPEPPLELLDTITRAEFPRNDPALRQKVEKNMLHGRDHLTQPGSRCNRDGWCIYGFPQRTQPSTTIDEHMRIHWRRHEEEDMWAVPYCPALLSLADCHFHFDVVYTASVQLPL
ncbi:uncharacterized protein F5147DRAFT_839426 [Suillus discolor]|uniref:Uncharacterized protein n=1 Tax=Suillus discolor TaxID=1912936 RepID=A0A9P7EZE7_9AGAM|nr:uncharacterized protein F5147DRAFT_839426 [Suillus discolor]KAG2099633.1 hypothetical protein F5147DRAFT_839426 [Suillus discolor]